MSWASGWTDPLSLSWAARAQVPGYRLTKVMYLLFCLSGMVWTLMQCAYTQIVTTTQGSRISGRPGRRIPSNPKQLLECTNLRSNFGEVSVTLRALAPLQISAGCVLMRSARPVLVIPATFTLTASFRNHESQNPAGLRTNVKRACSQLVHIGGAASGGPGANVAASPVAAAAGSSPVAEAVLAAGKDGDQSEDYDDMLAEFGAMESISGGFDGMEPPEVAAAAGADGERSAGFCQTYSQIYPTLTPDVGKACHDAESDLL